MPINPHKADDLALALAAGDRLSAWASSHGVAVSTCYSWRSEPGFRERVERYRAELRERTLSFMAAKAAGLNPPLHAA
jgi:hypothetical protein